jgi:hypothetical protein
VSISAAAEVLRFEPSEPEDTRDFMAAADPLEPLPAIKRPIPGLFAAGTLTRNAHTLSLRSSPSPTFFKR